MIVVDTSVWIAARRQARVAAVLDALLDTDDVALALPVRFELWAGVAKHDRKAFQRAFGALPQLIPTEETWRTLPSWIERAADAGERFAITDLLIASLAAGIGALVWSLDSDFARMERLKFVSTYEAPIARRTAG
ncbi:MAG TPA: PIN domain-containing protein [Vicinamibacterales bacterium]|nr:PIN domain-containing protein [Vicinamibacterales bacterium]